MMTQLSTFKSGGFLAKTVAPVRGMERGKSLSLRSRERGGTFFGLALLAFRKWWFFGKKSGISVFSKGLLGPNVP